MMQSALEPVVHQHLLKLFQVSAVLKLGWLSLALADLSTNLMVSGFIVFF